LRSQRTMANASAAPTAPAMVVSAANERHYQEVSSCVCACVRACVCVCV